MLAPFGRTQQLSKSVTIHVDFDKADGPLPPVWNYFGYDEPNYSYAPNGKKLLGELAALSPVPVYIRTQGAAPPDFAPLAGRLCRQSAHSVKERIAEFRLF